MYQFPNTKFWEERRFREVLTKIKTLIVHSNRVSEHLSNISNTIDMSKKYKIISPCTNLIPKYINFFDNRTIDIIFFEKYADLNRRKQGNEFFLL